MRIGLLPLDERPVNTRYPAMLARVAGIELIEPPATLLSARRQPASVDQLGAWLRERAPELDALIVSIEMLAYGGLIASRTTHDAISAVVMRLEVLQEVKNAYPALTILGFNVITRISNADDNTEEPLYWQEYGTRLYRCSQLLDRQFQGQEVGAELADLKNRIPQEHVRDFLGRRLRNHAVNLAVLEILNEGVFDLLVLSSDDTSAYGLGSREKRWLREWADLLVGHSEQLLMYPGADEVGCALLARLLNREHGRTPRFMPDYAIQGDEEITAPFEDGPLRVTLERQMRAVGGALAQHPDEADFIVAVNTPAPSGKGMFDPALADDERAYRFPHLELFVDRIAVWVQQRRRVIVADVAYPNGADPVLVELLRARVDLARLAAYGGWNTAGNTIGVALAQGVAGLPTRSAEQEQSREQFLVHRFVEDWAYQHVVRAEVGMSLLERTGSTAVTPENEAAVRGMIEERLAQRLAELPEFGQRWRIVPGSLRLPWQRLFEVDFDLERVG